MKSYNNFFNTFTNRAQIKFRVWNMAFLGCYDQGYSDQTVYGRDFLLF
jgi:hypothetical protein